jgi:hypothetical protein
VAAAEHHDNGEGDEVPRGGRHTTFTTKSFDYYYLDLHLLEARMPLSLLAAARQACRSRKGGGREEAEEGGRSEASRRSDPGKEDFDGLCG